MASSNSSSTNALRRKPRMSVRHLNFVDLVTPSPLNSPITKTPSPMITLLSPSLPNAPSKLHLPYKNHLVLHLHHPRETSSPFSPYYSSQPINPYIQDLLDVTPRTPPPLPLSQEPTPIDTQLILSPTSPLDYHPASPTHPPFPYEFFNPLAYAQLHGEHCLCCINTRNQIQGLRGEVSFLTTYIERLLNNYSRSTSSSPSTNYPRNPTI
ncbi:hypothetical protein Tco_0631305 [Tanacetum coccineum]